MKIIFKFVYKYFFLGNINPGKYDKIYRDGEEKKSYLKFSLFSPRTIPLIRPMFSTSLATKAGKATETWINTKPKNFLAQTTYNLDPTSEFHRTSNPIKVTKTESDEASTQLSSDLVFKGAKTYHTSPSPNTHVSIYGIHQNVRKFLF